MTLPSGQAEPSRRKPCLQMTLKSWTIYWEKSGISGTRCAANLWKGESSPTLHQQRLFAKTFLKGESRGGEVISWGGWVTGI